MGRASCGTVRTGSVLADFRKRHLGGRIEVDAGVEPEALLEERAARGTSQRAAAATQRPRKARRIGIAVDASAGMTESSTG